MKLKHLLNSFSFTIGLMAAVALCAVVFRLVATGCFKSAPQVGIVPTGGTNGTLRVVTDADYWPYSFIDGDGRLSGREIEIANDLANRLGMDIDIRALDWNECIRRAERHEADIVLTCEESGGECENLIPSLPIGSDDYVVFGREKLGKTADLRGKRLAQLTYGNVNPTLAAAGLKPYMKLYPSHREVFMAIERGEADYTVIRYTPALGILKDLGFGDIRPQCFAGRSFFCIGVDNAKPELVRRVNDAIMDLRMNGELGRLSEKWLTTYVKPVSFVEMMDEYPLFFILVLVLLGAHAAVLYRREKRAYVALARSAHGERLRAKAANDRILSDITKQLYGYNLTVNLGTMKYTVIIGRGMDMASEVFTRHDVFTRAFAEKFRYIVERDKAPLRALLGPEELRRRAQEGFRGLVGSLVYEAEIDGVHQWHETNVFIESTGEGEPIANILGRDVTRECLERERLRREEKVIADRNRILSDITKARYGYNVTVDLKTLSCSVIRGTGCEGAADIFERCSDYAEVVREYRRRIADPESWKRAQELFDVESIRRIVAEGGRGHIATISYPVRSANPGEENRIGWREAGLYIGVDADGAVVANILGRNSTADHERDEALEKLHVAEETNRALADTSRHEKLRADALGFLFTDDNLEKFIPYLAKEVLDIYGCDQVIYRDSEGRMILNEKPGTPPLDFSLCANCPHYEFDAPVYADGVTVMDDCSVGYKGVPVHRDCRVKASLTNIVSRGGKAFGYIALHYLSGTHHFTALETASFDRLAKLLSLALDRMDANARLRSALATAEAANKAKSNFLFSMSHDIRTPLNAILGFTEMAERSVEKGDAGFIRDCLVKTRTSGGLLLGIINSILDMSRIEAGKSRLEESAADVLESFRGVDSTMLTLAKSKEIDLVFEFGEISDRHVYADIDKTNRVFVNMISNAVKYTKPGGWVKVRCEQLPSANRQPPSTNYRLYRYTFEDNGIGMSEEFQKHVFEEFARESNSTTSGIQGTGLGLPLSKAFVELMGGTISCRSKQGVGTTFTVELPFRVREAADEGEKRGGAGQRNKDSDLHCPPPPNYSTSFAGKRVLLVEDNELNREVAEFLLKTHGFEVDTAANGQEAVEKAVGSGCGGSGPNTPNRSYDLILMDIQMPVMDGYEATRRIRAREKGQGPRTRIPIIAVSANAFAEDQAASLDAGMDAHIAKPIKSAELLAAISRFV